MPYRVVKPKKWPYPDDYGGMNSEAAHELGFKYPYGENTVAVRAGQGDVKTRNTVLHESVEANQMKHGKSYHAAHKVALKFERAARKRRSR
jgi:hypothetical protein